MKKTLTMILMFFMLIGLTSCGSFFGEDESILIESIKYEHLEEKGVTRVTVTYLSPEDKTPDIFEIPDGVAGTPGEPGEIGEKGNGIASIDYEYSADGFTTKLVINYTDENTEPTIFNIPNGRSVSGVRSETDRATGNTLVYVQYSDGTESEEPIIVRKGVDGNSIIGFNQVVNEDLSVELTFQCSQSDDVKITIPAPQKGEQGVGVESMIAKETATEYQITVKYTDGKEETLRFTRPADPNSWSTGSAKPLDSTGRNGDFFFDTYHKKIYYKENGSWSEIVDFSVSDKIYTITFYLNDTGSEPASMPPYTFSTYKVKHGEYFTTEHGAVPIPTRTGYTFKGWYLTTNVTPVNSPFTDFTPVFSDLKLYACWEKNE